jgi:cell division cycle 20-like protein 1 (cofactor of APC complex)
MASASDDHLMFDDSQYVNMSQTVNQNFNVLHFNNKRSHLDTANQENLGSCQRSQIVNDYQASPLQQRPTLGPRPQVPKATPFAGFDEDSMLTLPYKQQRKIQKAPFKVLDAPALQDDYYLNLVDWSNQNVLAVGLGSCVYLWSASTSKVTKLYDLGPQDQVTSVSWSNNGDHLAVGTSGGVLQNWDVVKQRMVRKFDGHEGRIGCIAWNNSFLSSGSRDKSILHRDPRQKSDFFAKLEGHKQEVCGLKWSPDEQQLASGGNDNKLMIWSKNNNSKPQAKFSEHVAAVKAIAWSPHQHGAMCSGGGTADRCIRFWNTLTLKPMHWIDTGSQVCNLVYSKNVNELVSTHGYSKNEIIVWKQP